ncbi:TetR/AcrR family transcriptional regulator [Streptomyces sp. NBC_00503]|uniref:TetR/AcrR family transcriptional regulator n=1 Tax=Streptomyces sp. NBC_00503 TaxID=2903659 RepID=UPI002E80A06B|nr:helix-turn-helix domain-containing protein [Streptomyces sp. NBC_00503]WUD85317.1 TetR/AcrR family transcriptional regulator [Streptomyces sp. NBC_00503]
MSTPTSPTDRPRRRRPYAPRVPITERREQLLDAALALIVSDGYGRISIDAIAKRAGVARSVVYGAFDDLDALLLTLLDRQQEHAYRCLLAAAPDPRGGGDPIDFACEAVHRMGAMLREDPDTWRLILLTPATTPPAVHARIEADRERFRRRVASWIGSLLSLAAPAAPDTDAGSDAAPAPDPEVLAHALVASAEHFARLALTSPGAMDATRLAGQVRLLLGGFRLAN